MALTREQKEASVLELVEKIKVSTNIIVWEYHGLDSETIGSFRLDVREKHGLNKVFKNRLAKIAFQQAGKEEVLDVLTGPNSFLFTSEEDEGSMKILADLVKDHKEAIHFKGGYINGEWYDAARVQEIASLPGKEDLVSMLLSVLQAPMRNLAYTISQIEPGTSVEATEEIKDEAQVAEEATTESATEEVAKEKEEV